MLLQRLNEYGFRVEKEAAEKGEVVPPDYTRQTVPWIIDLDTDGKFVGLVKTASEGTKRERGKKFVVPYLRRSGSKVKPQLLADKAEFVLGISDEDEKRAQTRHSDFVVLSRACLEVTQEKTIEAVVKFLERKNFSPVIKSEQVLPGDFITFRVLDVFPINIPSVQGFWRKVAPNLGKKGIDELTVDLISSWATSAEIDGGQKVRWNCLICGNPCLPARVHPIAIKLLGLLQISNVRLLRRTRKRSGLMGWSSRL